MNTTKTCVRIQTNAFLHNPKNILDNKSMGAYAS